HHVAGEPAQLLLELLGPQALGPMDHEILEAGVFRLDRFDAVDDMRGRAAEPSLLFYTVREQRHSRRRPGRAPGAAMLVGVADKAEGREPLVALVMRRLDPSDRLFLRVGEIEAGAPNHVLAELLRPAMPGAGGMIGAHYVVQDLLAVQRHHGLEA